MNLTAAQRFMTDTQFAESISKQAINTPIPINEVKSTGVSIGQVVTFGLIVVVAIWQIREQHKRMEKILYPDVIDPA